MPSTTPPKGQPTVGKIDRESASRVIHRRNQRIKLFWIALAVLIVILVVYFGSNSGSGGGTGTPTGF